MNHWAINTVRQEVADIEVIEESALAMAQSTIQNAINESGISRTEMARRMDRDKSFVSRVLSGSHNLTIKTMARSMAACGFEVRFQPIRLQSAWVDLPEPQVNNVVPANAGTTMLAAASAA
jgi:plasmid maintenance system antidote protein VapI